MFEDFGERLRRLRTNAGFTQGKLAQRIGRGVTTISKYESGAMLPTMEAAVELAFQLNVSLDELFGYENAAALSVVGLSEEQREIVSGLIAVFRAGNTRAQKRLSSGQYELLGRIVDSFYK